MFCIRGVNKNELEAFFNSLKVTVFCVSATDCRMKRVFSQTTKCRSVDEFLTKIVFYLITERSENL